MKKLLYILATLIMFASCRSIDKMIESGNYDLALRYGVDKLRGEKNKKTKYVKALEKAYTKLNKRDRDEIKKLELHKSKNHMDRVVDIYQNMEKRQSYVFPLVPLRSKDGYLADIPIVDYSSAIHESKIEASEKHYLYAMQLLEYAKINKDKISARKAYSSFNDASFYFKNYKDSYTLKRNAYELGQTNILIETYVSGSNVAFEHTSEILAQINNSELNTKWKKYYNVDTDITIDYVATIEVSEIVPGKEKERYNSFTNTKEIVDGRKVKKNENGKVMRDTLGEVIYTDNKIVVSANVEELLREKISHMSGKLVIIDVNTNNHITTIPISVTHIFEDYSCVFRGDERALTNEYNKRIKNSCAPFPSDYDMTTILANEYKKATKQSLKNENLI